MGRYLYKKANGEILLKISETVQYRNPCGLITNPYHISAYALIEKVNCIGICCASSKDYFHLL